MFQIGAALLLIGGGIAISSSSFKASHEIEHCHISEDQEERVLHGNKQQFA